MSPNPDGGFEEVWQKCVLWFIFKDYTFDYIFLDYVFIIDYIIVISYLSIQRLLRWLCFIDLLRDERCCLYNVFFFSFFKEEDVIFNFNCSPLPFSFEGILFFYFDFSDYVVF